MERKYPVPSINATQLAKLMFYLSCPSAFQKAYVLVKVLEITTMEHFDSIDPLFSLILSWA
jgi:hypothetical protein